MSESRFGDEMVRRMNVVIEDRILHNPVVLSSGRVILEARTILQTIRRRLNCDVCCGSGMQLLSYKFDTCPACKGNKVT